MISARRLDQTILRQYDIRGLVDAGLGEADMRAIGAAFGSMLKEKGGKTAAVGRDGRLSSPLLETALVEGLAATGVKVYRVGLGPTPMVYFADRILETDAALMVTGSHNPAEYNGVKMVMGHKPFFGTDIQRLGHVAAAGDFPTGPEEVIDRPVIHEYVERLALDWGGGRGLKVAWDAGNGAAGEAVERLTRLLPGSHLLLNTEIDGHFPNHHPDPTVEANLDQLKRAVIDNGCDLGLGFDGDGDRIGVIDGLGRVIWGDQLLVVLAREVLAERPGAAILSEVKASRVFFDEITAMGGRPVMWKTGHSMIKTKMAEDGIPLAGEMSGHVFFADRWYGFDDALYAAIRLLSILARDDVSLAEMRDAMPQTLVTPELRFDCDEDRKFGVIEEVKARLAEIPDAQVCDIDGVRVDTQDGWWLLRASNTQAVLVARAESATYDGLQRLKDQISTQLLASGLTPPVF